MSALSSPDPGFVERFEYYLSAMVMKELLEAVELDTHLADQIIASQEEGASLFRKIIPDVEEALDGTTEFAEGGDIPPEYFAHMLAAVTAPNMTVCEHLTSPQPQFIFLSARLVLCRFCVAMAIDIEIDENDDSCDFCRRTGVLMFTPIVSNLGNGIVYGEACDDCVEILTFTKNGASNG